MTAPVSLAEAKLFLTLTSTSPAPLRLAILMLALRAYERGDPEMPVAPVEAWIAPYRVVRL
ncbi:MAG: bacteriophage QLRG family, DNA packaging [bacterium]|nr:MAG: bacteriophage QLRG family, DNA packaging [bacterium]